MGRVARMKDDDAEDALFSNPAAQQREPQATSSKHADSLVALHARRELLLLLIYI